MTRGPSKWALLAALFVALVLADQATKYLAVERLTTVFLRNGETGLARLADGTPIEQERTGFCVVNSRDQAD